MPDVRGTFLVRLSQVGDGPRKSATGLFAVCRGLTRTTKSPRECLFYHLQYIICLSGNIKMHTHEYYRVYKAGAAFQGLVDGSFQCSKDCLISTGLGGWVSAANTSVHQRTASCFYECILLLTLDRKIRIPMKLLYLH